MGEAEVSVNGSEVRFLRRPPSLPAKLPADHRGRVVGPAVIAHRLPSHVDIASGGMTPGGTSRPVSLAWQQADDARPVAHRGHRGHLPRLADNPGRLVRIAVMPVCPGVVAQSTESGKCQPFTG